MSKESDKDKMDPGKHPRELTKKEADQLKKAIFKDDKGQDSKGDNKRRN